MNILYANKDVIYILVISFLLIASYSFYKRGIFDERRRSRYRRKNIVRQINYWREKLHNPEYELFLRRNGLPAWLTSSLLNLIRMGSIIVLIFIVLLGFGIQRNFLTPMELIMWGSLPIILTPRKPFPFYHLTKILQQKYSNDVSNEIYQLYNEIKSNFQINNSNSNTYFTVQRALPYYSKIRPTLEKMLPHLEKKELQQAWDLFESDLDTREASMLGIVMKEVESTGKEQALMLLEQKKNEFSNQLYNRYTDYLRRRRFIIYILVVTGALSVFFNEVTVFFMWYKEVMSVVNRVG